MSNPATSLPPGFRFHPTDEELILHYLKNRATSLPCPVSIIADVDIYKLDPWDLPAKAIFGEREWYFFTHRDRKYPNGVRPNRAAVSGYWKATGSDKHIVTSKGNESIGVKKALVFYKGRPPRGVKTCWIMHEYCLTRAETKLTKFQNSSMRLDDWVLCRIYKKNSHLRPMNREQEDSVGEDLYMSSLPNTTQLSSTKLQKSCSLSELLDAIDYSSLSSLFDGTSGSPEFKQGSLGDASLSQPFTNNSSKSSASGYQQLSRKESHVVDVCFEEDGGLKQSNPCILSSYTNQDDSMQNSLLSQTPFNQNWLLNSHLVLYGGHI